LQSGRYFLALDLFLNVKCSGLGPQAMDHARVASPRVCRGRHSGRWPKHTGAQPSNRSGARRLAARWGKWRRRRGASGELLTGGWTAASRQCIGGGASAQNGDDTDAVEGRRRRVGGVGCFVEVGVSFYWGRWRGAGSGWLQWPVMKEAFNAAGYWGNEEGGHRLMGKMMEEVIRCLFP
jgi:hypothetical protein